MVLLMPGDPRWDALQKALEPSDEQVDRALLTKVKIHAADGDWEYVVRMALHCAASVHLSRANRDTSIEHLCSALANLNTDQKFDNQYFQALFETYEKSWRKMCRATNPALASRLSDVVKEVSAARIGRVVNIRKRWWQFW